MITCIIIDDQKEAIEILASHVNNRKELELLKTFESATEAYNFLKAEKVDLVFIDIKMPKLTGLDLIESLRLTKGNDVPKFIITTGFDKYALSGFEQGVNDYLMKPITFKRFCISVDRFINDFKLIETKIVNDFLFVEVNSRKLKISFDDIAYIEAEGNYVRLVGLNFNYLIYNTLTNIIKLLPKQTFIRVQKSYIVSIRFIEFIKADEIKLKGLKEDKIINIGATFKESVNKLLNL